MLRDERQSVEILNSRPCILKGCDAPGVCWDDKYDTKTIADPDLLRADAGNKEYWLCQEHATEYLFPIIDASVGYTVDGILRDFRKDGMF